jgi:predicted nucleic acid-binding Zn ribbon protein
MPIYEYKCLRCKKDYTIFFTSQSAVEREERHERCVHCHSRRKKRSTVPKGTSHILKGKGWFRDGY